MRRIPRLIDHYMMTRAPLPCSDKALFRIVGCGVDEWVPISENVKAFFKAKDGLLHHEFCDETIAGDTARILKAQMNGSNGGRPSASKDQGITQSVRPTQPKQLKQIKQTNQNSRLVGVKGKGFCKQMGFRLVVWLVGCLIGQASRPVTISCKLLPAGISTC
jgi:uncharacterized protein YdaU (DUF1376 family)